MSGSFWSSAFPLFAEWYPATIVWRVRSVVVGAIYGQVVSVTVGQRPGVKWFKLVPLAADTNASAAVVLPVRTTWRKAASAYVLPDPVRAGVIVALGRAVLHHVDSLASAVGAPSLLQGVGGHLSFSAAVTSAVPVYTPPRASALRWVKCNPATKALVCDIEFFGHGGLWSGCCVK